jgi:hypothetical protein
MRSKDHCVLKKSSSGNNPHTTKQTTTKQTAMIKDDANKFRLMFGQPLLKQNMNQEQHQDMVASLAKNPFEILSSLDGHKCHLLHMMNGLGDEFFELDEELQIYFRLKEEEDPRDGTVCNKRVIKELGDFLFYTEGWVLKFPLSLFSESEKALASEMKDMEIGDTMKNMFECAKRYVFYNQPININQWAQVYLNLMDNILHLCKELGITIEEVRQANYDKLAGKGGRHEGGYSDQKAIDRVDTIQNPDPLGADKLK